MARGVVLPVAEQGAQLLAVLDDSADQVVRSGRGRDDGGVDRLPVADDLSPKLPDFPTA
ncbi:hypothetical protein ACFWZT_13995 [Streptomyces alboflavus]|uniref:hypothetical protein n=1 Tax=Streptomyces alboflavus TaxID=67267 RepID=UPI00368553A4